MSLKALAHPVQPDLFDAPMSDVDSDKLIAVGQVTWERIFVPVLRAAIDRMTHKEAAYQFKTTGPGLTDALAERDRKRPAMQWLIQLLIAAPEAAKFELLSKLCDIAGYKPPERKEPLTDSEDARIARSVLAKYPGALEMYEREKDRYRP